MIPVDLAARLRLLTEASFFQTDQPVHQLNRVREIQADPPEYTPGQRIAATIERPLPDGLFRALVAGKAVTLAIQTAANEAPLVPGRTLALEITRSTPQTLYAQLVPAGQEADLPPPALSQTGRLISILLTGQPAQEPTALAGGKPLLAAPPSSGASLVPLLKEALTQSGLFYEAHQAQWVAGKMDLGALRQEPQGRLPLAVPLAPGQQGAGMGGNPLAVSPIPASVQTEVPNSLLDQALELMGFEQKPAPGPEAAPRPGAPSVPPNPAGSPAEAPNTLLDLARELMGFEPKPAHGPEAAAHPATPAGAGIPERILPLVGQQLDALATQQFVWHGQVWPGQSMEWEIEDPTGGRQDGQAEVDWNTTLRLTLPQLGSVEARLKLSAAGITIRLVAAEAESRATLAAEKDALARGLDAAQVPLLGLSVEPPDGQP